MRKKTVSREEVSQLFLWGFDGTELNPSLKKVLKFPPAGLIFFRHNIESPAQLKKLTTSLKKIDPLLLLGIDQEGGRVSRLPPPWSQHPPACTYKTGEASFLAGYQIGKELREAGLNLDFAPVLDVDSNPKNPIIGDRAFASTPEAVIQSALPFAQGLSKAGIIPCGKHFPGHGDTDTDSHETLPFVSHSRKRLEKIELPPFQAAIREKIPMLMTAHVLYPAWDKKWPATLSRSILKILRDRLHFRGLVISDDLLMKGIANQQTLLESSLRALEAGVDLLLICKGFEKSDEFLDHFYQELIQNSRLIQRCRESLKRLQLLRKKHLK